MLGRESIRELIRNQHAETMRQLDIREQEARRRAVDAREEAKREWQLRDEENREFMREILLRNEKVYTSVIAKMEEGSRQLRANTQAVLSVLDRLGGTEA